MAFFVNPLAQKMSEVLLISNEGGNSFRDLTGSASPPLLTCAIPSVMGKSKSASNIDGILGD